jgi:DNA-binding transcriptional LysR family regulator
MADNTYRYLNTLIQEGSFSRAAQALEISQPSLSQFIQRLEADIGSTLIDRNARPVQLTYAGECFLETEKEIAQLRDRRRQQIADIGAGIKGKVRIGASHYRSTYFLTAVLPAFRKLYPNIDISLEEGTTMQLEEFVHSGKTDVSLVLQPLDNPELTSVTLYREKLLIALAADHPLIEKLPASKEEFPPLPFEYLDRLPFIRIKKGQKFQKLFEAMCEKCNVMPFMVLDSESPTAALALASVGLGATFVTETLARRCHTPAPVRYFRLSPEMPDRVVVAAYKKDRYLSKAAQALIEVMKHVGEKEFSRG